MCPGPHLVITPQTLQGTPSYADIARRRALASSGSQGVTSAKSSETSDQPLRSKGRRPVNNPTPAIPATASTTRLRTTRDTDTSEVDTAPNTRSRDVSPNIAHLYLWFSTVAFRCSPLLLLTRLKVKEMRLDPTPRRLIAYLPSNPLQILLILRTNQSSLRRHHLMQEHLP
jgi:hypothetical protein